MEEVPVLIVGGSLVGLTTAALLGHHGVPALVLERHAGTAIHPRAGHFQVRTLEIMRQLGLEERVRTKALETYSASGGIIAVESLAGREIAVYVHDLNEGVEGYSPTVRVFINQDVAGADPARPRARARRDGAQPGRGARTRAGRRRCHRDGARSRPRQRARRSASRYVVAADGNRSPTRERLGIRMEGYGELSRSITIYFRADCSELIRTATRASSTWTTRSCAVSSALTERRDGVPRGQYGRRGRDAARGDRRPVAG